MIEIDAIGRHLKAAAREFMIANQIPGMALALTDRTQTLWLAVYGYADLAAKTPLTADTLPCGPKTRPLPFSKQKIS